MSFLAIDMGNTRLKWALYEALEPGAVPKAAGAVFLEHIDTLAEVEWSSLPQPQAILGCAVAGDAVRRRVEEQFEPWDLAARWVVPREQEAGVANRYEHPSRLGADRWVAVIAARARELARAERGEGPPRPVVVVMIGTAVTVEALSADGQFLGGLILPGHGIMLRALESGTAGLRVPTGQVVAFPVNTSDALTSGGTFAITGAMRRMHQHLSAHSQGQAPHVLVTGGAGWKVAPHIDLPHELADSLIFDGLLHIEQQRRRERAQNQP